MTTEITAHTTPGIVPAGRDALMHAFSVGETVASGLEFGPSSITLDDNLEGTFVVIFYFHNRPDRVAEFAAALGVEVSARPHQEPGSTYTSAESVVSGVKVRGWALTHGTAAVAA
ncbi:hypothetical protein [Streptomyces sp. NPDC055036]